MSEGVAMKTLQQRIDDLPKNGGVVHVERDEYIFEPLTLHDRTGVILIGRGPSTRIFAAFDKLGPIIHGVDLRASTISLLRIVAQRNVTANLLLHRSDPKRHCKDNVIRDVQFVGEASVSTIATIGAERLVLDRVYAANEHDAAYTYMTSDNGRLLDFGSAPDPPPVHVSNSVISLRDCTFLSDGNRSTTVLIDWIQSLTWTGGFLRNKHSSDIPDEIRAETIGIYVHRLHGGVIQGLKCEGNQTEIGALLYVCEKLHMTGTRLHGRKAVAHLPFAQIKDCTFDRSNEWISQGDAKSGMRLGQIENCLIDVGSHP
jgi:hypothetical protein